MTFDAALRAYGSRPSSNFDPYDPFSSASPTYSALRRVVSPVPMSSLFSRNLPVLRPPSTAAQEEIVPGPLGIWQTDSGRPYEQVGKFGINLLGSGQGFAPGSPTPYLQQPGMDAAAQLQAMADPGNPDNRGFIEGLLGGIGGLFGEGGKQVGGFIGSALDLPMEAAGNVIGLPFAFATSAPTWFREGGLDPDIEATYQQIADENPINGLLMWSQAAKAQWQRDVAAGRMTGLFADFGPAVALTDFMGYAMNAVFGTPFRVVQRGVMGGTGYADQSIRTVESAVLQGEETLVDPETGAISSTDPRVKSSAYARLQQRLARGDFGRPGSQEARDKMMDALILESAQLRDVGDEDQHSDLWFTGQGLADMAFSLVTDPLILASFGIGAVGKVGRLGTMAANAKFWTAVPREQLPRVLDEVEQVAMRLGGYDDPARAWSALSRSTRRGVSETVEGAGRVGGYDPTFESRVYREVMQNPEFASFRSEAEGALRYIDNWRQRWEPAIRPITETVRNLNDPFRLFGVGRADRAMADVYSAHATEGLIRGQGSLDAHANLQDLMGAQGEVLNTYNRGLGVAAAFESRAFHRSGLMSDLRRRIRMGDPTVHDLMNQYLPDEILQRRLTGSTARDIASGLEKFALRHRPLYLATERGGAEAALERARAEAAGRLQLMGLPETQAVELAGRMGRDEISLLDLSYFGYAMDQFVSARRAAMGLPPAPGALDFERLTMLGPRQITEQQAARVLEAAERGDITEVRSALQRFDILFENLSESLDDVTLLKAVRDLLSDQIAADALPRELTDLTGLTDDLRRWAQQNGDLGYRVGFRPADDQLWRATMDAEGRVVGINPWVEVAATASDVPTYNRWRLAKDGLFHAVRGERIMADARVRLAQYTSERWGLPRSQSDALFARFLRMAQESGITPRGLSPEQVFNIVKTHGIADEIIEGIGVRESIEALLTAFEGHWQHVGLSQKFTGYAKTALGGQSNWIGQVAEKIYPAVRFTLNPLFQAQEMTEPFILNLMRGVRPGLRASELDEKTLQLVEVLIRDSKYAYDDQIEYAGTLLWGADSARAAFGANSRLGKVVSKLTVGGLLNVKEVKRVNYARALRATLADEFREAIERVSPDVAAKLRAHYATDDWGEIAVRYLTEKGWVEQPIQTLKPSNLGARDAVNLDKVALHFDGVANAEGLRAAVRSGALDETGFRDTLISLGADDDFVRRAYMTASARFTPEEFWDEWRTNFRSGNQRAANADRALVRAVAEVHGMNEAEYLAKTFADVPMSADSRALAALADEDKRWFQFMAEAVDEGFGRTRAADEAVERFRAQHAHIADREHFAIIDDSGEILAEGQQDHAWHIMPSGAPTQASLGDEIVPFMPRATGRTLVHNHPSHNPFSPADIATAAQFRVKEMIVTSPGITYSLTPPTEGWYTDDFTRLFGDVPEGVPETLVATESVETAFGRMRASEEYWDTVREAMHRMWHDDASAFIDRAQKTPFYTSREGRFYEQYLDSVATQYAVRRMAERFGWTFDTVTDFRLPTDPAARHALLEQFAANPPSHLRQATPYAYRSEPLARHDLRAGSSVSFEYTSRHRNWMPENLPEQAQRQIMDGWEDWARARVAPLFGAVVTDVRRSKGGWVGPEGFSAEVNAVMDVFGPDDMVEDVARAYGYLLKQDAVVTSRPKAGRQIADPEAGERWSINFIADKELTGEQAAELAAAISAAAPKVGGWGSSVVTAADGRTAIRFIDYANLGSADPVSRELFLNSIRDEVDGVKLKQALSHITSTDTIDISPDVVDYRYVTNDWDGAAAHGEDYLAGIRQRRPDVVGQLEHGLAEESEGVLASLVRANAPAEFDAHLAALRARGESVPEFRVPGQYSPIPLADRVAVSIPGGREGLLNDPTRSFTLWEQQIIKAQVINASAAYNADPDLYTAMMKAIWRSKDKVETDPMTAYNAFAFAALTSNAALDTTEAAFALLRANVPGVPGLPGGLERLQSRAKRVVERLPVAFRQDPAHIGLAFQLDEGMRVSGYNAHRATWLLPEERTLADRLITRIDSRMRALKTDEERVRWAKRIQQRLDGSSRASRRRQGGRVRGRAGVNRGNLNLQVHPWPTESILAGYGADPNDVLDTFVSIGRPSVRFRGANTNTAWGRVLRWSYDNIFTSESAAVQRFLQPQLAWESRLAYGLRMSSILPGIDVKTAMLALQSMGPSKTARGALDTHIVRYVAQQAARRGDIEDLLSRLSPAYADHLRAELQRTADGLSTAFKSPETDRVYLLPEAMRRARTAGDEMAQVQAMRDRLHLIPDPEMRALYDDDEVLRLVARTGGKVNFWGGDYAVLEDYFQTVLRADEVASLRAAGHTSAADAVEAMSGGEWQWFKWDHIRSAAAGTPLDPHVGITRGAELNPARAAAELDRNLQIVRQKTPYDPVNSMVLQEIDGKVLGANQILEDGRRILLATQHADARTGLHELAHVFEQHLDPSLRQQVLAEFRTATGSRRRTWSREVSEWWADSFLDYSRARAKRPSRELASSFDYFRKTLNGVEASIRAEAEARVLERAKQAAIRKAQRQLDKATPTLREVSGQTRVATQAYRRADRDLRRARARASLPVLEGRRETLKDTVIHVDQNLRDARARVRVAISEAKAADLRATQALGTGQAGGLRAAANRARARIAQAEAEVASLSRELDKARAAVTRASRAVAAAKRRVPVRELEAARDRARAAADAALRKQRAAQRAVDDARRALGTAKGLSTRPARAKVAPLPLSDEMRRIWDSLTTPPERKPPTLGTGQPYDPQQEAVYQAAAHALSRSEEDAFRLHYYKRGRSFVERSINHPYFGLYPASYMWGKILPEMIRFLLKTPFGLDAPLGGLALSHNVYRGVLVQQQYDPEFRREMVENKDLWHFVALMTPSLPWEVPVNAPLWMRRVAEGALVYDDKLADYQRREALGQLRAGEEPPPLADLQRFGSTGREMLNYAFGPAAAFEQVTAAISSTAGTAQGAVNAAVTEVENILRAGNGAPTLDTGLPPPGTLPPSLPGQSGP